MKKLQTAAFSENHITVNLILLCGITYFGCIIGSFLTVCIYRIPYGRQKGAPDFRGDSEAEDDEEEEVYLETPCDSCNHPYRFYEKIPFLSWFLLKGSCPYCKERILFSPFLSHFFEEIRSLFVSDSDDKEKLTVSYPKRSFCTVCGEQLSWYHNIPVLSWLFLGGRCAFCKTPIPLRYPVVELLTAFAALLTAQMYLFTASPTPGTAAIIFLSCCMLIVISFIDIEYYIIPNRITYPGVLIAMFLVALNHGGQEFFEIQLFTSPVVPTIKEGFYGYCAGAGFLYVVARGYIILRKHQGLGLGDVKLLAVTGILFGWPCALATIFLGSLFGAAIGGSQLLLAGSTLKNPLPFGPYLALGTMTFLFAGQERLLQWQMIASKTIVETLLNSGTYVQAVFDFLHHYLY